MEVDLQLSSRKLDAAMSILLELGFYEKYAVLTKCLLSCALHMDPLITFEISCYLDRHTLARLTAPLLIRTNDYVDEQGPKYMFYSFFVEAKHLVTWYRVLFAIFSSFLVGSLAYGTEKAAILVFCVFISSFFSGRYAEYLLGKFHHGAKLQECVVRGKAI